MAAAPSRTYLLPPSLPPPGLRQAQAELRPSRASICGIYPRALLAFPKAGPQGLPRGVQGSSRDAWPHLNGEDKPRSERTVEMRGLTYAGSESIAAGRSYPGAASFADRFSSLCDSGERKAQSEDSAASSPFRDHMSAGNATVQKS